MTKVAANTVEFPTLDAEKASEQIRAFAEKSVETSKDAYAKIKLGAENAQKMFESTFNTAKATGSELSLKSIGVARANAEAGFSHFEALVGAKSLSEVLELQTAFMRKSFETAIEQAKDFQTSSARAAEDLSKPFKDVMSKAAQELKVA